MGVCNDRVGAGIMIYDQFALILYTICLLSEKECFGLLNQPQGLSVCAGRKE